MRILIPWFCLLAFKGDVCLVVSHRACIPVTLHTRGGIWGKCELSGISLTDFWQESRFSRQAQRRKENAEKRGTALRLSVFAREIFRG